MIPLIKYIIESYIQHFLLNNEFIMYFINEIMFSYEKTFSQEKNIFRAHVGNATSKLGGANSNFQ